MQADKGFVHRKLRKEQCLAMWDGVDMPPPADVPFPPPPSPVPVLFNSSKFDFTECDMGGGVRTPLIKAGPQYYLRTLPSKPYYICSPVRGDCAFWWNESIGECGAEEIASVNYLYDTTRATGAGARTYWVDGTAAQTWNRVMFTYCLDCVNPESPTFTLDPEKALYERVDIYRNPPGHTFMQCDATHGVVTRYGQSLSHVASTEEWCSKVCAKCKSGTEAIDSIFMQQSYFRQWRRYLMQFYRKNPRTTTGIRYRLLDYHWANFGWGKDPSGLPVHHPHEVWFYKCSGNDQDEWHKETPIKVVFPLNCKTDGTLPRGQLRLLPWVASKGRQVKPLSHPDYESYEGPLPLELAKQWDLRTLSKYLINFLTQAAIDLLYPEPTDELADSDNDDNSGSDSDHISDSD